MSQAARRIIHLDMDAFYAAVEQRDDPALRGRPVVVGGSPESRGVVAAASYEARVFGVRSAMPMARAVRLCPDLVIRRPDFPRYREASRKVMAILRSATALVEPLSLDEAYLDVTENHWGRALATDVARELKLRIRAELSLTASAGVGGWRLSCRNCRSRPCGAWARSRRENCAASGSGGWWTSARPIRASWPPPSAAWRSG